MTDAELRAARALWEYVVQQQAPDIVSWAAGYLTGRITRYRKLIEQTGDAALIEAMDVE
jgi:hypothetical protein